MLSVYSMKYRLSLLENLFEVVSFDIVTDELPQITQCMGNTGHCYTLTGRNLSDNTNKRVHTLHTQAAAHQCLRVHWPRAMTSWRLLSDSHTHLMRKVNMHVIISPEVWFELHVFLLSHANDLLHLWIWWLSSIDCSRVKHNYTFKMVCFALPS